MSVFRLQKVSVLPCAKVMCCLHAAVGLVMGLMMAANMLTGRQGAGAESMGVWTPLFFPFINAAMGFLTGAFLAWVYNFVAGYIGGLEFELEASAEANP